MLSASETSLSMCETQTRDKSAIHLSAKTRQKRMDSQQREHPREPGPGGLVVQEREFPLQESDVAVEEQSLCCDWSTPESLGGAESRGGRTTARPGGEKEQRGWNRE